MIAALAVVIAAFVIGVPLTIWYIIYRANGGDDDDDDHDDNWVGHHRSDLNYCYYAVVKLNIVICLYIQPMTAYALCHYIKPFCSFIVSFKNRLVIIQLVAVWWWFQLWCCNCYVRVIIIVMATVFTDTCYDVISCYVLCEFPWLRCHHDNPEWIV